jgi:D-sedoheptulose 7-phosphate isomerase
MTETDSEMINEIENAFKISGDLKHNIGLENIAAIAKITQAIISAYRSGKKVVLFGNGGSAADAQHIASELVGKFYKNRAGLPALALHTNTSLLTAVANDYDYSDVFVRQVEAHIQEGDIAVGISTSGNSTNIIKALDKARELGAVTVGLAGEKGHAIDEASELILNVPSRDTPRIQEVHITAGHIICYLVEKELFPD